MRKRLWYILVALSFHVGLSQNITVDQTTFSVEELVRDVLINSPCANVSNITWSTGTNFNSSNGIGYFEELTGNLFFERGIIMASGNAESAEGPNNTTVSTGSTAWPGDSDLTAILTTPAEGTINATVIEFDFIASSSEISFRFFMASEEYDMGSFECNFSDVFAFFLTKPNGDVENLAVLPSTDTGSSDILVTNVHPDNGVCGAANAQYFGDYVGSGEPPIAYDGYTTSFTASSEVIPGETYHIKLAIADDANGTGDTAFDSAVFLEAGSFNLGIDIGDDLTYANGNPACDAASVILDTEIPITEGDHTWFKDGLELVGETNSALEVTEDGEYSVIVEFATNCQATDFIIIEFTESPDANPVQDQLICDDNNDGFWNFDLAAAKATVLGSQSLADFTVTAHDSQTDADSGANPLPDNYINQIAYQEESIYIRIESNINQDCYATISFLIDVADAPSLTPVVFNQCDDDNDGDDTNGFTEFNLGTQSSILLGSQDPAQYNISYHINQTDADANNNPLPLTFTNTTINGQDLVVRLENKDITACYVTTTLSLVVNPLPIVTSVVELRQCDSDSDGFTIFNLAEANSLISTDYANETFTYYLSQAEAEGGLVADQITDPINYPNPNPLSGVVYTRIETTFGCYRTTRIDLVVGATQIPSTFNLRYASCDDKAIDSDNTNGIAAFDFSDATAQVEALFPVGQNLTITYYLNEMDALAETNAIPDISNYRNETSPFFQEIYIRVDSDDVNACLGLGSHITLTVDPVPLNNPIEDYVLCSDTDQAEFDLTTKGIEVIGLQTENILISYHLTEQDAINNIAITNPTTFANTVNSQTIYVRAQFDTNGNGVGDPDECVSTTDMRFDLVVIPNPIVVDPDPIRICSDQEETIYDLTVRKDQITNNDDSIVLTYYNSQTDLDNNNPIPDPENYLSTSLDKDIIVLATGSNSCTSMVTLPLKTILYANINRNPQPVEECETDNNGFDFFDLTRVEPDILNGLNPLDYTFVYYETEADAIAGNFNSISNPNGFENSIIDTQLIYARFQPVANECFIVVPFQIIVNPVPEIQIEEEYVICLDNTDTIIDPENMTLLSTPPIDTQLNSNEYTFQWYFGTEEEVNNNPNSVIIDGATEPSYFPMEAGDYTVIATNITTGCTIPASTLVIGSYPPESISVELISPAFVENNVLEVTVVGNGEYEYSINSGPWQESNVFENVPGGEHVIAVRDIYNCNEISTVRIVIDYQRFFTPNGDGYFDTWNITGIRNQPNAIIYIFDRYGKLIKQLSPVGLGWDGTFNGEEMPSSDYWFTIEYNEPLDNTRKQFRGHFALKR